MAAAVTTTATAIQVPRICKFSTLRRTALGYAVTNLPPSTLYCTSFIISASKSPNQEVNSDTDNPGTAFTFQEDLNYFLKLGAGSVVGAAAIKYGSILLPEITRPNIYQALTMIFAPVVVAVVLLIKGSQVQQ